MKRLAVLSFALVGLFAFAEDAVPTESWLLQILTFVSTVKGLSTVALAAGITQLVMVFFKTPLAGFAGKYKLLLVSALTPVSLLLAAMATGVSLKGAIGQAPVIAALQVFLHQAIKQFTESEQPQPL